MSDNVLAVQNLHKAWGDKVLFRDLSFGLERKQKVGLLGQNGSGKSTLLKVLAGREFDFTGTVTQRKDLRVHYVEQEAKLVAPPKGRPLSQVPAPESGLPEGWRLSDYIFGSLGPVGKVLGEYHDLVTSEAADHPDQAVHRSDLENRIEDGHGLPLYRNVVSLAGQLQIDLAWTVTSALSGGQLKKIQLIRALSGEPDLLLIDEPTNHLDEDAIRWLENRLIQFNGTLVLITHDRYFLERVVNHILELSRGQIRGFPGNYVRYLEKKAELEAELAGQDAKRLSFLRNEIDWIRRGPKARGTKAKARIDRFEAAQAQEGYSKAKTLELDLQGSARLGRTILEVKHLRKSFGDLKLFQDLNLSLLPGDCIGILGPKGCGKSTFLKILLGQQKPEGGEVVVGQNTVMAYFDQKRETLDPLATVWKSLNGDAEYVEFGGGRLSKRNFLESFLFPPAIQQTQVGRLSGGEQNRLQLAASLVSNPANLLVLDEPTNDLDIATLQVLEEALEKFPGCALIVSHDRYFLDRVATAMLVFGPGGQTRLLPGNYSDYLAANPFPPAEASVRSEKPVVETRKKDALSQSEKKEFGLIEKRIIAADSELSRAEAALGEVSSQGDFAAIQEKNRAYEQAQKQLEELYARWEYLERKSRGD